MRVVLAALVLALTCVGTPGCMTIARTAGRGKLEMYAGTRVFVKEWPPRSGGGGNPVGALYAWAKLIFMPIDLPFSFVLDTAMLPFTALATLIRRVTRD